MSFARRESSGARQGSALRATPATGAPVVFVGALAAALAAAPACGDPAAPPPPAPRDGGVAVDARVEPVDVTAAPLGLPELASYAWRRRAGQPAFRTAREAEAVGDWQAVVVSCRRALAADPLHLEAAYLLAVAHAKLGALDEVLAPLQRAVAGHLARWGAASLAQPALQGFLATPAGEAWRRRVELDRARYAALLGRAVLVLADGELHAFVPAALAAPGEIAVEAAPGRRAEAPARGAVPGEIAEAPAREAAPGQLAEAPARGAVPAQPAGELPAAGAGEPATTGDAEPGGWLRLTETPGSVVGALAIPAARRIAYVARYRPGGKRDLALGVLDLDGGASPGAVLLGTPGPIEVAYSARPPAGVWIGSGPPRRMSWRRLDEQHQLAPLPPRTRRPAGAWLEIPAGPDVRVHARPANVTADWDERGLASAIRLGRSRRVVAVPSPFLVDGSTAAWSPDRVQLAFVARLDDCAEGAINAAAFVVDAATGGIRELARATGGIALQWLAERTLVIAGDGGVAIHRLDDGGPPRPIRGATDLLLPRAGGRCTSLAPDAPDAPGSSGAARAHAGETAEDAEPAEPPPAAAPPAQQPTDPSSPPAPAAAPPARRPTAPPAPPAPAPAARQPTAPPASPALPARRPADPPPSPSPPAPPSPAAR